MKNEVLQLMIKNHSQLEIAKALGTTIDHVIKMQDALINGNKNTANIESTLANITAMEAEAYNKAMEGNPVYELLIQLEKARY